MNDIEKSIVQTAIGLFQKYGYNETSINAICTACGVTKGTFYYHFNAKSDIIFRYYEMLFQNILTIMPELLVIKDTKQKLWKIYEYSIDNTVKLTAPLLNAMIIADTENGSGYFSALRCSKASEAHQIQLRLTRELVVQGQAEGVIQADKDPDLLITTYNAILMGMALDWSSSHGKYDQKKYLKQMFDIVFSE